MYFKFQTCDPPLTTILRGGMSVSGDYEIGEEIKPEDITGIKFEFDDAIEKGESVTVWFVLSSRWEKHCPPPNQGIQVFLKGGKTIWASGWICGPNCVEIPIPEVPLGTISIILAALTAFGIFASRKKNLLTH